MLLKTILADLRSNISTEHGNGLNFWIRVIGKLLIAPAVQVVVLYRISTLLYRIPLTRPLAYVLRSIGVVWCGTEIHPNTQIGPGLCILHSQKVLIGPGVTIGSDLRMSHGVSIGGDAGRYAPVRSTGYPTIGDHVTIALDAIILGHITVGDGAVISGQSFVVKDVPPYTLVAGSPARVVRQLETPVDQEQSA